MWEEESKTFLQTFIDNGTIMSGSLIGIKDHGTTQVATAIVVMLDVATNKAVEKYYYIVKKSGTTNFYEMDKLPSR